MYLYIENLLFDEMKKSTLIPNVINFYTQEKDYWILKDLTAPNCLIERLIFCPFYLS